MTRIVSFDCRKIHQFFSPASIFHFKCCLRIPSSSQNDKYFLFFSYGLYNYTSRPLICLKFRSEIEVEFYFYGFQYSEPRFAIPFLQRSILCPASMWCLPYIYGSDPRFSILFQCLLIGSWASGTQFFNSAFIVDFNICFFKAALFFPS